MSCILPRDLIYLIYLATSSMSSASTVLYLNRPLPQPSSISSSVFVCHLSPAPLSATCPPPLTRLYWLVYAQGVEVGAYGMSPGGGNTSLHSPCSTSVYSSWAVVKEKAARKGFVACAWSPHAGLLAVGAEVYGGGGGGGGGGAAVTGGACLLYAVEKGFYSDKNTSVSKGSEDRNKEGGKEGARVALVRVVGMAEGYVTGCVT
jgi:hypothetical protein